LRRAGGEERRARQPTGERDDIADEAYKVREDKRQQHVTGIAVDWPNRRIAAGGHHGAIHVWNIHPSAAPSDKHLPDMHVPAREDSPEVVSVALCAGRWLVAGRSGRADLLVYDVAHDLALAGTLSVPTLGHKKTDMCMGVAASPASNLVFAGYSDNVVRVWRLP